MGGLFGGGGGGKSRSKNLSYPWIMSNYGRTGSGAFNAGTGMIGNLLGLGGDPAASQAALDQWWNSSGGKFLLNKGMDQVNSNFYSRGLGESGAAMQGMEEFRQGLASTKLNELMQNYMGLAKLGLGAGQLVSSSGVQSTQDSGGGGGLGQLLGLALAFI